ncbi:hypothetical protein QAD02_002237 [Eretmocerus hayati]|uniref:Uncharacterized protein n=1 Tax=Eretmocerus hayati TaxID=131215 RepID=A0ACC2NJA7_9HYME|nr:hypothetical protein QAD02_002237 [Eretmocerus hayati]
MAPQQNPIRQFRDGKALFKWIKQQKRLTEDSGAGGIDLSFRILNEKPFSCKDCVFPTLKSQIAIIAASKTFRNCPRCVNAESNMSDIEHGHRQKIFEETEKMSVTTFPSVIFKDWPRRRLVHYLTQQVNYGIFFKCEEHKENLTLMLLHSTLISYFETVASYVNRVLCGKAVIMDKSSVHPLVIDAHELYIRTLRKTDRPKEDLAK